MLIGPFAIALATQAWATAPEHRKAIAATPRAVDACNAYTIAWSPERGLQTPPGFPADLAGQLRELYEQGHAARTDFIDANGGPTEVERRIAAGDEELRRSLWALDRGLRARDQSRIFAAMREFSRRCDGHVDSDAEENDNALRELLMQEVEPPPAPAHRGKAPPPPKRGASRP